MATLAYGHSNYSNLISLVRMHVHYAVNSTADKANFVHQVAYICLNLLVMINTVKGPRPSIDPGNSSPQGEHVNHYTNEDRLTSTSD